MKLMNVYKIEENLAAGEIIIGIASEIHLGENQKEFNTFKNIKYLGITTILVNSEHIRVHKIQFCNLDENTYSLVNDWIITFITKMDMENLTLYDIFANINDYFATIGQHKALIKDLLGDLGEILFIYMLQEHGIDYQKFYQKTNESLYDFNVEGKYIDIKVTSVKRKLIKLTYRQLSTEQKIVFYCFEINKIEGHSNISDIISLIKEKNACVKELEAKWNILYELNPRIIDSWTIDLDNIVSFQVDQNIIPIIEIIKLGGMKEIKIEVDVTTGSHLSFEKFIYELFPRNKN